MRELCLTRLSGCRMLQRKRFGFRRLIEIQFTVAASWLSLAKALNKRGIVIYIAILVRL